MNLANVPYDELVREVEVRQSQTFMEDAEWKPKAGQGVRTRGRGHHSKSVLMLQELAIGDVKRIYHHDIYCQHKPGKVYCGLSAGRDTLKKRGFVFHIYHEQEHVAIVARIS